MTTPTPERIRLTISVTPEVHDTFTKLAGAANLSLSKAMGDWLADTAEAAQVMATMMEEARSKPKQAMRRLQGMALGLVDVTEEVMDGMRSGKSIGEAARASPTGDRLEGQMAAHGAREAERAPRAPLPPRPVIRGGKSPSPGGKVGRT